MLEHNHKWDFMYRNLKLEFPSVEAKVIDWWPISRREIMVQLHDGSKMVYDDLKRTIRLVGNTTGDDEDEWRRRFSRRLEELMRDSNVNGKDLAEYVGVSVQMISRYLNRKATPNPFVIQKMARMFNTTSSELTEFVDVD